MTTLAVLPGTCEMLSFVFPPTHLVSRPLHLQVSQQTKEINNETAQVHLTTRRLHQAQLEFVLAGGNDIRPQKQSLPVVSVYA